MVSAAAQAAQASTVWMSRRMRVPALASSGHDHHHAPPPLGLVRKPTFAQRRVVLTPVSKNLNIDWSSLVPKQSVQETLSDIQQAVSAKIQEKYAANTDLVSQYLEELNKDVFWSKYSTIDQLASVESKDDIMKIIFTFQFISKKSVYVFSTFARKIIANKQLYSVNEIASIMHAFAQLGFLEESFCIQLSERLTEDMACASAESFVWIADAFASTRCYHETMVNVLFAHSSTHMNSFTPSQVSLFLSALARLNVRNDVVYEQLGNRLVALSDVISAKSEKIFSIPEESPIEEEKSSCTARDVTLAAYAFAKMKVNVSHKLTETIIALSKQLIRDFTAKELQMLITALDRLGLNDHELFSSMSVQAQRRIAQFSCDTLVHFMRAMANRNAMDQELVTRVVCQLPRLVNNIKAAELVGLFQVFADLKVNSKAAMEALRAPTVSKAGQLSSSDWLTVLEAVADLGASEVVDEFIDAFTLVNASPANYRSTTTIINATVVSRMTNQQVVSLVSILSKTAQHPAKLLDIISSELGRRTWSSNDASDVYCTLVKMNMHKNEKFEGIMRHILAQALHA
jgi:hypothetical protein